jgi:hypothetical protein
LSRSLDAVVFADRQLPIELSASRVRSVRRSVVRFARDLASMSCCGDEQFKLVRKNAHPDVEV